MKFEIKHRWNGSILFSGEFGSLKLCVEAAIGAKTILKGADLKGADLKGADLEGAYLEGAYLEGAYLEGADLKGADLKGADLKGADLEGAYLEGADLKGAYLEGAYLKGADLKGADLEGADLEGATRLSTGETWQQYLDEVVPALLTAGGKTIEQVVASGCWDCHSWDNCPLAFAFDVHDGDKIPKLLWPRRDQFIQLFDAKLIPRPKVAEVTS